MKAIALKEGIYWVGGIDWNLRNFHGYLTQRGSTYNAYLIVDKKIALIDTVKYYLIDEMLERITSVIDPSAIDIIISNHVEMDHSGAIPHMRQIAPNAEIITSPNGAKGLPLHFGQLPLRAISNGETISLGARSLTFILTPMVHWPDNMFAYCPEEKILFSNDAFGQHIATSERFEEEYSLDIIMEEAKKYYANIVLPYGNQVQKALHAAENLSIDIIAPSHGIIWRTHVNDIIGKYAQWATNTTEKKALIVYDTMWKSTEMIAHAIYRAFEKKGYYPQLLSLQHNHISDIMTELLTAEYICVGSPTLNNNMLPTVSAFLTYLKGLAPKGRKALAFGSFGWGGQSIALVEEALSSCGFEMLESIKVQYVPTKSALDEITQKVMNRI
ncbi:MAG: FprA family A-type flavoprotein [Spirochaetes bacterium]|nr:FprA family A-type flavoprotein [Spirochaetota bacterium]